MGLNYGEIIARERKKAGKNQQELADAIGVNRATLSKYESGAIIPSVECFERIANALGLKISEMCMPEIHNATDHLRTLKVDKWTVAIDDMEEVDLLCAFRQLNETGQQIAVQRVEELGKIPEYRADLTTPAPEDPGNE